MKKKIVLLTLAAVLALSATACGSGDSGTEPKDEEKQHLKSQMRTSR